jgi:ribulose-phosphate 3-epimerase
VILAPSILACDFSRLGDEVRAAERGGATMIHVDVMDGRFVPNLSLGPAIVEACRRVTRLPIDAHLMVEDADRYLDVFVDAGATYVSVHVEAVTHLQRALEHLRGRGVAPGVALNPATPVVALSEILPEVDYVNVMSVNPGFSGQKLLPPALDKLRRIQAEIRARGLRARLEIDGGVSAANIRGVVEAGAEIVVAGSAAFAGGDPEAAVRGLIAGAAA